MINFLKTRNVKSPEREDGNAGFDFFVPSFDEDFVNTTKMEGDKNPNAKVKFDTVEGKTAIVLDPHKTVSIPSGIHARVELEYPLKSYGLDADLVVENKSGIATKYGLDVGACEIDPNYKGEIHLSLTNTSDKPVVIHENDKITQIVPRVYLTEHCKVFEVASTDKETFYKDFRFDNRGEGWAGSTNK